MPSSGNSTATCDADPVRLLGLGLVMVEEIRER
jgi:hypothetical protein